MIFIINKIHYRDKLIQNNRGFIIIIMTSQKSLRNK